MDLLIPLSILDLCHSMSRRLWYSQSPHQRWKCSASQGSCDHLVPCLPGRFAHSSADESWRGLATNSFILILPGLTFFVSKMASLRFDGYAIDYVDYPAGMEWFLKREVNLHRTVNYLSFLTSHLTNITFCRLLLLTAALLTWIRLCSLWQGQVPIMEGAPLSSMAQQWI